jgi:catechol 2,3-dioxygenase-like lactoylglutathione lyase family enzyme
MNLTDVTPNLIVADIDRSTAFYRDVLGFSVVTTVPEAAPFVFVWLQRGGVNVFLNAPDGTHVPALARPVAGTATLFMTVEAETAAAGVDALFAQVESKARVFMPLVTQFYGMREFGIEDPDGYMLFFAQRVA